MPVRLNRKDLADLKLYLTYASARHLSVITWGSRRQNCHGEGRSRSKVPWHIGIWKQSSDGHHLSCIVTGGEGSPEVWDSRIDHGTTQPSMIHVLNEHKRMYEIGQGVVEGLDSVRDDYEGYYYIGPNGEYNICDASGNDIGQSDSSASTSSNGASSSHPSYYSSRSRHSADSGHVRNSGYADYFSYSTTSGRHTSSSSVQFYRDSTVRLYYVDRHGNAQWA
ncbi:hypothetical protein F5Y12DRAFT_712160 [Xylaria sp. FL1777]|nr:hypothetical protein F5Y12DRAFT_712160 [Xylaria sp. FL1777]